MTTALADTVQEGVEGVKEGIEAHHTNVFVLLDFGGSFVKTVYGPFRTFNSAKDWGLVYSESFTVVELMRPRDIDEVGFVLTPNPREPTLEDQGIHRNQAEIGDYIDPNVAR